MQAIMQKSAFFMKSARFSKTQNRSLFGMLNSVFNKPDPGRIEEVGAERACAEWLLRCGVKIRWKDSEKFQQDYNSLPPEKLHKYVIEEIDADEAAIMQIGFPHFVNCDHIKKARFYHCMYFTDDALHDLGILKDSLTSLEIGSCGDITDTGLLSITQFMLLQNLSLYDLPEVKNKSSCYNMLRKALPNCEISYRDLNEDPPA